MGDDGEVWDGDSFLSELSGDESLSPEPSGSSQTLSGELSLPPASSDPRLTFPSMRRSGNTAESGSTKERKEEEGAPPDEGNAAAPNDLKHAVNMEDPGIGIRNTKAGSGPRNLESGYGGPSLLARRWNRDPPKNVKRRRGPTRRGKCGCPK